MRVSPEYLRFLREEISSVDYAEAITESAKLEGLYRAPAARFSFPRRSATEALLDGLRFFFALGGMVLVALGLLTTVAPLGAMIVRFLAQWAWTMSIVGVILLSLTLRGEASCFIFRGLHSLQRFVSDHLAHQRA
jgi:hypothetical protein